MGYYKRCKECRLEAKEEAKERRRIAKLEKEQIKDEKDREEASERRKQIHARELARNERKRQAAEKQKADQLKRRNDGYTKLCEYFLAHPCIDCGETDVLCLKFIYKNPNAKGRNPRARVSSTKWENVIKDIEQCNVVCANCHSRRMHQRKNTATHQIFLQVQTSQVPNENN
jgi:hypothetical protein